MDNEELKEFSRCLSGLDDAFKSSVTGCDVLCEIQTLVKYLKQLAVAQDYGSDILRDLTVYSAVWHAGRCQGIREERAKHKKAA